MPYKNGNLEISFHLHEIHAVTSTGMFNASLKNREF